MKDFERDVLKPKEKNTKWYVWLFVALLGALLLSNLAGETIKGMFFSLLAGITPIIVAVVLAFLLLNPIKWIENKMLKNAFVGNPRAKSFKRAISLGICYFVVIGIVVVLLVTMLPYLISTFKELASNSEAIISDLKAQITNLIVSITGLPMAEVQNYLENFLNQLGNTINSWFNSLNVLDVVSVTGNVIFIIFMSLLLSFLMLKDKELIANTAKRYNYAYNTKRKADELLITTRRSKKMLDQWVMCNIIMMIAIFVVAWIGYAIIGVKFAGILALLLAVLSIIPYIGGFIAMVPVVMVTLVFGTTSQMLASVIFGLATWTIITSVLPPFIMANRLKTRAVVLLLTMVIGGALFGIWGMLLSGPIAAILTIFLQERLEVREAMREREEMIDAGIADVPTFSVSEMLDTQEDTDPTVLDIVEEDGVFKNKNVKKVVKNKNIKTIKKSPKFKGVNKKENKNKEGTENGK